MAASTTRRRGHPRTRAERMARHKKLYGASSQLPPRGTGLRNRK